MITIPCRGAKCAFFFFQAEDGIRDGRVAGVQTCALPIFNRAEIARVAFQGRAHPLVSVVPPGVPDAIDLNEMYPYKPDEAKRLLHELDFDRKNPLKLTILTNNVDVTFADVAALIKEQMAKIGIEAKIHVMDSTAYVDRVLVKHDFDMTVASFANLRDINQRSVSFFKGHQSDYVGID